MWGVMNDFPSKVVLLETAGRVGGESSLLPLVYVIASSFFHAMTMMMTMMMWMEAVRGLHVRLFELLGIGWMEAKSIGLSA